MTTQNWLDLNEFSAKYKISLSTLRRRIKFGEVENFFRDGKYWVPDLPIPKNIKSKETIRKIEKPQELTVAPKVEQPPVITTNPVGQISSELNSLVSELKSAYVTVLHEKEDQITQLKEEIADLKTLVKILESENERLSHNTQKQSTNQPPILQNWQLGDLDL